MFALGIYDLDGDRLLSPALRWRVKPLYVAEHEGRLLYASELRALPVRAVAPAQPRSQKAIGLYLSLACARQRTAIAAIRKVPARLPRDRHARRRAHRALLAVASFRRAAAEQDVEAATREARRCSAASARPMLLADVPVGRLAVGGLDSSVLAG